MIPLFGQSSICDLSIPNGVQEMIQYRDRDRTVEQTKQFFAALLFKFTNSSLYCSIVEFGLLSIHSK